jgi:NTP pyrophosphatase (non-canonical NTP hydrolase)
MNKEVLLITQEECAEVTQAISKIFRFGVEDEYNGQTNLQRLEEEVGDLLCMLDLLLEMVSKENVMAAKAAKLEKLRTWSNIH